MKSMLLRVLAALVVVLPGAGCVAQKAGPPSSSSMPQRSSYTCGSCGGSFDGGGNCPKCGLELKMKPSQIPAAYK